MERIQKIQYKGKEILYIIYDGLNEAEMIALMNQVEKIILSDNKPHLQLLNLTNTFGTPGFMAAAKEFGKRTRHLTLKSAAVGVTGVKALLLKSYNLVSGSDLKAFKTEEEAKEYLVG